MKIENSNLHKKEMQESQKISQQIIHRTLPQDSNKLLSSKKISMNYPHKLKTESIEEYQALNFQKKENYDRRPIFDSSRQDSKRMHCIIKPLKSKFNEVFLKLNKDGLQNFTTEETSKNQMYPNLVLKRSGSTAPGRNRLNSQNNKSSNLNQQQKPCIGQKQKQKDSIKQSVSSIFHYHNSSLQKISNKSSSQLIRLKSKPHLMFCSSKLPKDFFGESIVGDAHNSGNQYKFVVSNNRNSEDQERLNVVKKLKCSSSVKLMKELKNCGNLVESLHFDEGKVLVQQKPNQSNQTEFTFRKQKSKKCIDLPEQPTIQTPKFSHKHQITSLSKQNESLPNLMKSINMLNLLEPKKKLQRNYFRQQLKL